VTVCDFSPPYFCDKCGAAHRWLSRQGRIYMLQNLLDEQTLDAATRLEVQEQLRALTQPDLPEDEPQRRCEKVGRLAPARWNSEPAQTVLDTVVSAGMKAALDR